MSGLGGAGRLTYSDNISILDETGQLLALGSAAPELASSFICGNVNGAEGELVGLEDSLDAGGCGDDVRGPRRQGGVEIQG